MRPKPCFRDHLTLYEGHEKMRCDIIATLRGCVVITKTCHCGWQWGPVLQASRRSLPAVRQAGYGTLRKDASFGSKPSALCPCPIRGLQCRGPMEFTAFCSSRPQGGGRFHRRSRCGLKKSARPSRLTGIVIYVIKYYLVFPMSTMH